ncbi:hypothetical protein [Streptomyces sp. Ag109_O5-10]|uniref:hypothetical protein n=1 Tax=Streptomyces sp. Ag109_O5-10 TaxID=1855349 RepID=UPI000895373A|nr:hypothetical protein [Streptomyces sp. Ag109_O5-10]SEF18982.1 hypothetical protein SAMN05216533_8530 [Streptomyces sp. Ag109_O5-10]
MPEANNGVTAARWNTNPVHSVGFFDRTRSRRLSELLAAAAEYFQSREESGEEYLIHDVRYRTGRDGVRILEVDVMEGPFQRYDVEPAGAGEANA